MANAINRQSTSDDYTTACTIERVSHPKGGWFAVDPNHGDVYVQLEYLNDSRATGNWGWAPEFPLAASAAGSFGPDTTGIRFRSATAGKPAIVTASIASGIQPLLTLSAFGTPAGAVVNYLGVFTVAQWPPSNPNEGDIAIFADLYQGLRFAFPLAYQPSTLGVTYPWGPPAGLTLDYATIFPPTGAGAWGRNTAGWYVWGLANGGNTGWGSTSGHFGIPCPRKGIWATMIDQRIVSAALATAQIGVNSSDTVAPAGGQATTVYTGSNGEWHGHLEGVQFTLNTADKVYGWWNLNVNDVETLADGTLGLLPVQIA